MNSSKYANILKYLSFLIGIFSVLSPIGKWISGWLIQSLSLAQGFSLVSELTGLTQQEAQIITQMPILHKLLGFVVDGVSVAIFLLGLHYFVLFTNSVKKGQLFSPEVMNYFNDASKCALWWCLYEPIKRALLSVVMSLHNPPGQRMLTVDFGSDDIVNIFVCIFLLLIALMIKEAYYLKKEQDLMI